MRVYPLFGMMGSSGWTGLGKIHCEMDVLFRSDSSCTVLGGNLMILRPAPVFVSPT